MRRRARSTSSRHARGSATSGWCPTRPRRPCALGRRAPRRSRSPSAIAIAPRFTSGHAEFWELDEYARILAAARKEGPAIYAAACLAGEAGLRVGEVKALRWREDVDMVARTITVNQQMRRGVVGTPKGRTRRTVPMTSTLFDALRAMPVVREGYVVLDQIGLGIQLRAKHEENVIKRLMNRVCRLAGLPQSGWHRMRHSYGTHAATFGVKVRSGCMRPWRQA